MALDCCEEASKFMQPDGMPGQHRTLALSLASPSPPSPNLNPDLNLTLAPTYALTSLSP